MVELGVDDGGDVVGGLVVVSVVGVMVELSVDVVGGLVVVSVIS